MEIIYLFNLKLFLQFFFFWVGIFSCILEIRQRHPALLQMKTSAFLKNGNIEVITQVTSQKYLLSQTLPKLPSLNHRIHLSALGLLDISLPSHKLYPQRLTRPQKTKHIFFQTWTLEKWKEIYALATKLYGHSKQRPLFPLPTQQKKGTCVPGHLFLGQ